ncbi:MAG: chemotaxis protein CheA, partial [Deltaproteobacteria bacterium]|nr:chemotaxis protein CheA [Deltaproteobacteria bacterium]
GQNVPDLTLISEEIERLTAELRDNTMNIRMLPIGTAFSKFKRVVRDLSRELGKEVTLTTEGAETELDKNVIEQMGDPMVHIIRNCIDHGIERPEVREAIGKDRKGTIHVSARHSGAHVLIQVSDDGAGIDKGAVLAKAEGKGIVAPDSQLSDKEIFDLLFAPGFSTAAQVTSVSGRGVGMDVVKRNIDALGGTVELTSQKEKGTTLSLKLPLTLAIIDSLLVKVAHAYYALPHSLVLECIELTREDVEASHGRDMSNVR